MGEYLTADMLIAVDEISKLANDSEKEEVVHAAGIVVERIKEELNKRPGYNTTETDKIINQIYENFGQRGYISRSIICVTLLGQVYANKGLSEEQVQSFNIIEQELKSKRAILAESETPKR